VVVLFEEEDEVPLRFSNLTVAIHFLSSSSDSSSCILVGAAAENRDDCIIEIRSGWEWNPVPNGAEHKIKIDNNFGEESTRDTKATLAEAWQLRAEEWEICVRDGGSDSDSGRRSTGLITLLQRKDARSRQYSLTTGSQEASENVHEVAREEIVESKFRHKLDPSSTPLSRPANLVDSWHSGVMVARESTTGVDYFVNSLMDEAANASMCNESNSDPFSSSLTGRCTLRSAVAACELLLISPTSPGRCSVHLPVAGRLILEPSLKELYLNNTKMNGTLALVGNGCHLSPNTSASLSMRFLHVNFPDPGGFTFSLEVTNLTLTRFGDKDTDGGAMMLCNVRSSGVSLISNVIFTENKGLHGGAVFVSESDFLILKECTVSSNFAVYDGGGLYIDSECDNIEIDSSVFIRNTAQSNGGGVCANFNNLNINFLLNIFADNSAGSGGGGVYLYNGNEYMSFLTCSFENNTALAVGGGGIFADAGNHHMNMTFCSFVNNTATAAAGGVSIWFNNEHVTITSCLFEGNTAFQGSGGLLVDAVNYFLAVNNCTFLRNRAVEGSGGGILIGNNNINVKISSTLLAANFASKTGGGIYINNNNDDIQFRSIVFQKNAAEENGGGMYFELHNDRTVIADSYFWENDALSNGGGISFNSNNDNVTFLSCVFFGNTAYNSGGGVFIDSENDNMLFEACSFENNTALFLRGGALFVNSENFNFAMTLCALNRNTALSSAGGGLSIWSRNDNSTIKSCSFHGNKAFNAAGGGLHVFNVNHLIAVINTTFAENHAQGASGGGVYVGNENHYFRISSCTFVNNSCTSDGGGVNFDTNNYAIQMIASTFQSNSALEDGGGVFVGQFHDFMTIIDSSFIENSAKKGAGVYFGNTQQDITLSRLIFARNFASVYGGGFHVTFNVNRMSITDCSFSENSALSRGGGALVDSDNVDVTIFFCNFTENTAAFAGGLSVGTNNYNLVITACVFTENTADQGNGGGIEIANGNSISQITSCIFRGNFAMYGGGLHLVTDNEFFTITSCIFSRNRASNSGGGIYFGINCEYLTVLSCSFAENAASHGGGLYLSTNTDYSNFQSCNFSHNNAVTNGGGMYTSSENSFLSLAKCNFVNNSASSYGGGLLVASGHDYMTLTSCTFIDNLAKIYGGGLHLGSNNMGMTLDGLDFQGNSAGFDGGAISLMFDNWLLSVKNSLFHNNAAQASGGAIHSALQNNDMLFINVNFVNNSAHLFGGAIYVGEDHSSFELNDVRVSGCSADSGGGGLFISRFCSKIFISSSSIEYNYASIGAGLMSLADSLVIRMSKFDYNTALSAHGGVVVENAVDYVILSESSISYNTGGALSGGLRISKSTNVTIDSCLLAQNQVMSGSGGAVSMSESHLVLVRNVSFSHNRAVMGGAFFIANQCSRVSVDGCTLTANIALNSGGAIFIAESQSVELNDNIFSFNQALQGSGSAVYVQASGLSLSKNEFGDNFANGGGTVFWEHTSGMMEPSGLQSVDNIFFDTNYAAYGPQWATDAHHTRLADYQDVINVEDYENFAPPVNVLLQDVYDQVVVTDSSTLATVAVPDAEVTSCNGQPGFVSGSTVVPVMNGTAKFLFLEPLCAPNYTLGLAITTTSSSISESSHFDFKFRPCTRGEFYGERICSSCAVGTYSFTDPAELSLSELTKTAVCQPCPSQATLCYKDVIVLKPGHWRSDNLSTNIMTCPWHSESCRGGASGGDASCGEGYHGPLCAVCDEDRHFVASSRTCVPCDDTESFFDPFKLTVLALLVLSGILVHYGIKRAKGNETVTTIDGLIAVVLLRLSLYRPDYYDKEKENDFKRTHAVRQRAFKSCVVYITFYQIVSTLPFILADVDFPNVYDEVLSAVSVVNLAINQEDIVRCTSSANYDYVVKLVVSTSFPLVCVLLLWLCSLVHISYVVGNESDDKDENKMIKHRITSKYMKAVLVLSFLILPSVSVLIFQTFSCHNVGSEDEEDMYMTSDYRVSCDSKRYKYAFWWAISMVFVYPVGIPFLYFCILYSSRDLILAESIKGEVVNMLCEDYLVKYWYWTVVDAVYRVFVTGVLVLFNSTVDTIMAGVMLTLIYLKAVQLLQPFSDTQLNIIKEISLWQIFFVFLIALLIKMKDSHNDFLAVCLLVTFFANFIFLGGQYAARLLSRCIEPTVKAMKRHSSNASSSVVDALDIEMESRLSVSLDRNDSWRKSSQDQGARGSVVENTSIKDNKDVVSPFHNRASELDT